MRKVLFPLAAIIFSAPQAAIAESVWLLLSVDDGRNYSTLEKIEMKDMEQCEEQGAAFLASKRIGIRHQNEKGFECLKGK